MNCFCDSQLGPIYKGDDFVVNLAVVQPDGSKMDFNGKTIKFIIKKSKSAEDSTAIVSKTYTPNESAESLTIHLTKEETDVDPSIYWYGVRVIVEGYQATEAEGKVEIVQGPFYGE